MAVTMTSIRLDTDLADEAVKILGTHLRQHRRVARVVEAPVTALQVHDDAREIGELLGAFDRGV